MTYFLEPTQKVERADSQGTAASDGKATGRVTRKVNREIVLLLGWGRALLLQLAHPLVARAIADHSDFSVRRLDRLHRTLEAMLALTFGTAEDAASVAESIKAVHECVRGRLHERAGIFPAGTEYSAGDPALLRWVHATTVDSFLCTYELYVGPLTREEKDEYCTEARGIERLLGIPGGYLPKSVAELRAYLERMLASSDITVTHTARTLAKEILFPRVPWPGRAIAWPLYLPTIGLLPPPIRDAYGFSWDSRHEAGMHFSAQLVRALLELAPPVFRHWPAARRTAW